MPLKYIAAIYKRINGVKVSIYTPIVAPHGTFDDHDSGHSLAKSAVDAYAHRRGDSVSCTARCMARSVCWPH
jgi:hypothetical protein